MGNEVLEMSERRFCPYCGALISDGIETQVFKDTLRCRRCTSQNLMIMRTIVSMRALSIIFGYILFYDLYQIFFKSPYAWIEIITTFILCIFLFTKYAPAVIHIICDVALMMYTATLTIFLYCSAGGPERYDHQYYYILLFVILILQMPLRRVIFHTAFITCMSGLIMLTRYNLPHLSQFWGILCGGILTLIVVKIYQRTDARGRQKVEEEKEKAYQDLEEAHNALKDTQARMIAMERSVQFANLAAGVCHDVNNPLGALKASVDIMSKSMAGLKSEIGPTEKSGKSLGMMNSAFEVIDISTGKISRVVNALRDFSQLDRAKVSFADINGGVENVVLLLQPHILSRVRVEKELKPIPRIKCNLQEINQAAMNLLLNAIEASPKGGVVTIRTRDFTDCIRLEVSDAGPGFSDHIGEKIFEPMYSTKMNRTGTGLTLVKDIAERHGGMIEYRSAEGVGSTFTLTLPKNAPASTEQGRGLSPK